MLIAKIAKYLTLTGMLFNVAWFFWNSEDWQFDWEPVIAFTLTLAGFVAADVKYTSSNDQAVETKAHPNDVALAKSLLELLPANGVIRFLREHDFLGSFRREGISPTNRFAYEWDSPEHEFVGEAIEEKRKELLNRVKDFNVSVAKYSSPNKSGFQAVKVDEHKDDPEFEKQFVEETHIINKAADEVVSAYTSLVRLVRSKLNLAQA